MMQEISAILSGGSPQIGLMFHGGKNFYIKSVPGFINVPFTFDIKKLKEFIEENVVIARDHAREYVKI